MTLLFLVVLVIAFKTGDHKYSSLSRALSQWDGQHYVSIARDGYEKYPCSWNPSQLCGNVGWFPFYPLVGRLISLLGISPSWSLIILSWLSLWVTMLLLFRLVETRYSQRAALFTGLAVLLFPGSFYWATSFPYSLFFLLAVSVFWLLHRRRYTWIFLLTACLTVTYPSGGVIGLPVAYHLVRYWKTLTRMARFKLVAAIVSMGAAMLIYFAYNYYKFDDFFLYLTYQRQSFYSHQPAFPLITLYKALTILPWDYVDFLIVAFTVGIAALAYSRRIPVEWQLYMFGILLFTPTFGTTQCYYRQIIVAFPLFVMVGLTVDSRIRKYLFALYAAASIALMWYVLLPAYKIGELM